MKFKMFWKGFVFEGEALEKYKSIRNKWLKLAGIGTLLPLVLNILVVLYNGKIDFTSLFAEGELILSLFSLNVPMLFDLFEIKKSNSLQLEKAFWFCALVVFIQLVFYILVKLDTSEERLLKGILTSIPIIVISWISCMYSIKSMAKYTDEAEANH